MREVFGWNGLLRIAMKIARIVDGPVGECSHLTPTLSPLKGERETGKGRGFNWGLP